MRLGGIVLLASVALLGAGCSLFAPAAPCLDDNGCTGRPTLVHGIDIATAHPHVRMEEVVAHDYEQTLQAGMVIMSEPNPATTDGRLGLFFGRTYIITEDGNEPVTNYPFELTVV